MQVRKGVFTGHSDLQELKKKKKLFTTVTTKSKKHKRKKGLPVISRKIVISW